MKMDIENSLDYINKVIDFRIQVFDKIISKNNNQIWRRVSLRDVRSAVIINAAPRSGSSLLFALLRKSPRFYSLSGESVPFYKLNGLSSDSFPSDEVPQELTEETEYAFGMSRDFLSDFSVESNQNEIFEENALLDQYIDDLALRLPLQWPQVSFSYDVFKNLAMQAFDVYRKSHQSFCKEEFYLELLELLRNEYKTINPYYYDIPSAMVRAKFPGLMVPSAPPNSILMIEEPPFILLSPRRKIDEQDLSEKTLLLKSSVDCYRIHFIETLLPSADIKIIYLARNPAASINGLYDGWLSRGFFSHNLKFFFSNTKDLGPKMLAILGYSDRYEWGKWWWKYDLPPGWQDYAQRRLGEVCAFQWYSGNRAIQEYVDNKGKKQHCLVKYENIIGNVESRMTQIGRILDFVGINQNTLNQLQLDKLPIIQATQTPQPYRWKKRESILLPLLDSPKISRMCARLGYDKDRIEEWL